MLSHLQLLKGCILSPSCLSWTLMCTWMKTRSTYSTSLIFIYSCIEKETLHLERNLGGLQICRLENNYSAIWGKKLKKHINTRVIAFYSWISNTYNLKIIKKEIPRKYQQNRTTVKKKPLDSLRELECFIVRNCHKRNRSAFWNTIF